MITPFPIEQAYALSTEAGWNQTAKDWWRIVALAPGGVYGIERDGRLVSSAVGLAYEDRLAWIGMVLTTAEYRGQGFARTLMQQALDDLDAAGVECVKLDATDLGKPVYAKLGFVDERPVSRWQRKASPAPGARPLPPAPVDRSLDVKPFGADRGALLIFLNSEESYSLPDKGFAYARPGRMAWHFGPCVARDPVTAQRLLSAFLHKHSDDTSILDLCDDHAEAVRIASEAGYEPIRRLTRMRRGPEAASQRAAGPQIFCLAGFEYG